VSASAKKSPAVPPWALVAAAGALVIGLAILEQRRSAAQPVPQVTLPLLDGPGQKTLVPGKVTLVDFWATWCAPCRASMPRVQKVWSDYAPRGLDLLSVDTDDGNDREPVVKEFLLQNQLTFPVVLDDGSGQNAFHVSGLPTMVLVGKDGKVVWRHEGILGSNEEQHLRSALDQALASR
jgi:thiol-disulfide isomerase/thioredoxin